MRMANVVSTAVAVLALGTGICSASENEHTAISTSTIAAQACLCPNQGDLDADGFRTALDLGETIDVLFEGTADPQDVSCPATRADFNGNGFSDAVDLILLVDHLFAGGAVPADPCTCPGGFPCSYPYNTQPGSAVTVTSKSASLGETGVTIPILLTNDVSLSSIVVPLVLRELSPPAFVTSLQLSWSDRLPAAGSVLQIRYTNHYSPEDGACKEGQAGGFGTIAHLNDNLPHAVSGAPMGVLFSASKVLTPLSAGSDATGSLLLTVDVTSVDGRFEIDTTCADPANHLLFVENVMPAAALIPSFTKGIITVGNPSSNNPPVAICQNVTADADANCEVLVVDPAEVDNGSFDPEGGPIALSLRPPGPYGLGATPVWLVVTDNPGDKDSCEATITVEDNAPPVAICPSDTTVIVVSGTIETTVVFSPSATDNCPGVTIACNPPSGSLFPLGSTPVTCIATDQADNTNPCGFVVTVEEGCVCPNQGDLDADGFPTPIDMIEIIELLFEGTADPQDVSCPTTRADFNGNSFADVVDLILFIDQLYAGGAGPADPCTCPGGFPCSYSYNTQPGSAVTVTSKSASLGETGVIIPILLTNDVSLSSIVVPLVLRELNPPAFVTSLQLSWSDRLPAGGPMLGNLRHTNQYSPEDGTCKEGQAGGFGTIAHLDDNLPHPVSGSPVGVLFSACKLMDSPLSAGSDVNGSLLLTVNVTSVDGRFEIDTTCTNPANHLLFVENVMPAAALIPSFTKGIITVGNPCSCPYQCDYDEDDFLTALDLGALIDVLFAGRPEEQDPSCPTSRGDFDNDGFPTAIDLGGLIDHLFAGGQAPCDPCNPVQGTCAK